ncbi:MAG TPA: PQQ-binding-like beta-propeller repeat protein [Vicinamibacteria bacterium]
MKESAKLVAMMIVSSATWTFAADWPGVYGPARNSTSDQKGLLRTWPAEGPKVLWTAPASPGFGGPAVSDGKVYMLDRDEEVGDKLRVFDLSSGKELWSFAYAAPGKFMFAGSRTTPAVDGERVYISGPLGDLYCIDTKTQKPVWHKNIWKDFGGGELPRWAIVQHPLLYGSLVIVAPQTSEAGVVAYDKLTGELKWKSAPLSGLPGYVSPSIVKVAGEDHVVMTMASVGRGRTAKDGSVNGLDPRSGKVLWTYMNWQCPIPVPQPVDAGEGRVLISGGYSAGSAMFKVQKKGDGSYEVTELFKNPDFGAHTQPPILHKDHFYSHYTINERSDGLVAMAMDGQIKWKTDQQPPFVRGGSILAESLLLTTDGSTKLYLIEPDPAGFKPLASAVVLEAGDNWAPLALVDGKLLIRGQKEMKCLQVAQ